jgi:hypothetical protein
VEEGGQTVLAEAALAITAVVVLLAGMIWLAVFLWTRLLARSGCTGCGKLGYLMSGHRCRDCSAPYCEECTRRHKRCLRCESPIVPPVYRTQVDRDSSVPGGNP